MTGMENCEEAEPKPSAPEPQPSEEDIAKASSSSMIPANSWFTPKRLLVVFCLINLLNYLDRGAIASNGVNGTQRTCTKSGTCKGGSGIQGHFNLNNFEDGMLSSAFMVGLLVASPIFAALAKSVNPFRLIGVGMTVWTLSTAGCGFAFSFWFIALCRVLVGVGEASFISLAAPFIDDNAPAPQKTAWLAIFYMCIPTGYALGYVYGGLVGTKFGWRVAFWVESVVMIPFVIMGFVMKPLQLKGFVPAESIKAVAPETVVSKVQDVEASNGKDKLLSSKVEFRDESSHQPSKWSKSASKAWDQTSKFMKDMKVLLLEKVFVINVLGAAFVKSLGLFGTFMLEVAGELMDFVPQSRICCFYRCYTMSLHLIPYCHERLLAGYIAYNFVIGAYSYWGPKAGYSIYNMTNADMIFGGITIICGIFGTLGGGLILDYMTSTISNAFKFLSFTTFLGAAFCFGAFLFRSMYGFLALFSIGELFVFATQGPVNYICLHCVTPSLRPLSMAMSTVAIHVFGDVPSSPLVGILQDHAHNWRTTTLSLTSILFLAAGLWFIGVFMHPVDRFNEESEHESSNSSPLLQENTGEAATSPASAQH